jgi:hypothetical protein
LSAGTEQLTLVGDEEVRRMGRERQGVETGLSRGQVAEALGVHVSSVRRYEERGWLHPGGGKGEERLFDAGEVKALARLLGKRAAPAEPESGAADAAVFRMFRTGATHEEVVIALELPAERVRELFGLWRAGYHASSRQEDQASTEVDDRDLDDDPAFREWERALADAHTPDDDWTARHLEARHKRVSLRRELAAAFGASDRSERRG